MRRLLSLREIQVHQEVKNERFLGQNFQNTTQLLLKLYIFLSDAWNFRVFQNCIIVPVSDTIYQNPKNGCSNI